MFNSDSILIVLPIYGSPIFINLRGTENISITLPKQTNARFGSVTEEGCLSLKDHNDWIGSAMEKQFLPVSHIKQEDKDVKVGAKLKVNYKLWVSVTMKN